MKINKINYIDNKNFKMESSLLLDGIIVGLVAGVIGASYRLLIGWSEKIVHFTAEFIKTSFIFKFSLLGILILLALFSGFLLKREPMASGSGIPQVSAEITGRLNSNPLKVLIYKITGGFVASLGGLSLGREGPSIQLGAMSGKLVSRFLKKNNIKEKYLITCGASAGLSIAFGAPLAGVLFSIEEVHKHITKKIIICCFSAAVVANIVGQYIFGLTAIFKFPDISYVEVSIYPWVALLGILLGIFGTFYNTVIKILFKLYERLNLSIVFRPQIAFLVSFILFIFYPIVLGSGHSLVEFLIENKFSIMFLLILYFIKTLFSLISFTSGVAGGIFLPILIQGAILGTLFGNFFDEKYAALFIILSMSGYLTAIVRSPITSIILLFEMTQKLNYFLPIALCCLFAYFTANILGTKPVYEYLLDRILTTNDIKDIEKEMEVEIITTVTNDSNLINKKISEIPWTKNILISNIERNGKEIIPKGDTILLSGDKLSVLMSKDVVNNFIKKFDN
ncbi:MULTISPECIES: ClC family H(+)/Cl(-) exchange transporter [Gemella]|uniref:ClC family H(+)/Cl(-) exchange transporter n=1 Tax=Gemella TaxID=1378 RepID=UPI0007684C5B|nr:MULTISPECIES: ClC family H(+)/Cl(-) exchange transporter [Gemella]AME09129.1 H(+)/Cl(-) exchange transporter ClcA [Gemella sp. oral taxon 928]AXI26702.1 ClC family H(+)/Cl(-) exchange transporter [Gemella sp. ND 6198]